MTAATCHCCTVQHAMTPEARQSAALAEAAAMQAGKLDLVAFYGQRLAPCPTVGVPPRRFAQSGGGR